MPDIAPDIQRRASFPACGRLIVLGTLNGDRLKKAVNDPERYNGFTAINFPAMPDGIELARRADYSVSSPWGFPDGIHSYRGTFPLEIPFSFKLHAFDIDYCPEGVKTLLQVAGILQSLVLPFNANATRLLDAEFNAEQGQPAPGADADTGKRADTGYSTSYVQPADIFPPATCYLELIRTEIDGVGIACVGYVKDVKAKLFGPFMQGPPGSQNLPMHGEFEFTFVHHPGHVNNFNSGNKGGKFREKHAFAATVRDRLYNTIDLMTNTEGFNDFSGGGEAVTPPAPAAPAAPAAPPAAPVSDQRVDQESNQHSSRRGGFLLD